MKKLLSVLACTALVLGSLTGCGSSAKKYPEKTINVVVPYTAGGGTDLMVRTVGANIDLDGQNMIVTNIEGASGLTGTLECYHADPDGYTLVSMAAETWGAQWMSGALDFDACAEMTPLCVIAEDPNVIAVAANSEWETFDALVEYAKSAGGKFTIASTSSGGSNESFSYGLAEVAGFDFTYVPYDGGAKSRTAVLGGVNDAVVCQVSEIKSLADAGEMRVLGVAAEERSQCVEGPTFVEQGYDIVFGLHRSLWGTPGLSDEVISYLEGKLETACGTDEVKQQLLDLGYEPAYVGSEELAAISVETSEQLEHWVTLIS